MIYRLGIFDSGIGGFTVLRKVLERHGDVSCVYLGDTARVPYGEKNASEIRAIASEVVNWLRNQDVSAVLVACNTTNSLAFDVVKKEAGVPVLGLINAAAEMINETRVGVLATTATASCSAYKSQIEAIRPGTIVLEQACPAFVPMIEAGHLCSNSIQRYAIEYLTPLLRARVQAVILGCSHYPFIQKTLQELLPNNIRLLDPAIGLANQLDCLLGKPKHSIHKKALMTNTRFCVTSDPVRFSIQTKSWLGINPEVEHVSLQPKACFS